MDNTPAIAAKTFEEFSVKNREVIDTFFQLYKEFQDTVKIWKDDAYAVVSLAEEAHEYQAATRLAKERFRGDLPTADWQDKAAKELGDVFFFLVANGDWLGWSMPELILENVEKIADRAARNVIKGDGDAR